MSTPLQAQLNVPLPLPPAQNPTSSFLPPPLMVNSWAATTNPELSRQRRTKKVFFPACVCGKGQVVVHSCLNYTGGGKGFFFLYLSEIPVLWSFVPTAVNWNGGGGKVYVYRISVWYFWISLVSKSGPVVSLARSESILRH